VTLAGPIRVLLADDHAPTREDIRVTLEADPRFEVCAEAADAPGAVQAAARERPDVCLLDVSMPGGGVAAAWEISSRLPKTRVVMLTVSRDDDDLLGALRAGASGYLLKDTDPARLTHALADVLEGEAAIPRTLVTRLLGEFRDTSPRRRKLLHQQGPRLTSREWEVLEFLRRGLSTADIAQELYVSKATVRSHVAAILHKLRVPDREAAIRMLERPEPGRPRD
jgi:DNA-binding NarL/FixJ family response regulator